MIEGYCSGKTYWHGRGGGRRHLHENAATPPLTLVLDDAQLEEDVL